MNLRLLPALALSLTAAFATMAHAEPAAKMAGGMLVNTSGMTLYTFDKDTAGSGKSACNGPCATLWPPAMVAADTKPEGAMGVVTRDDAFAFAVDGMSALIPGHAEVTIRVARSAGTVRLVTLPGRDVFATLRDKLSWGKGGVF